MDRKSLPGLRQRKRWYVKLDLSLFMKHWMVPSRDPGWENKFEKKISVLQANIQNFHCP